MGLGEGRGIQDELVLSKPAVRMLKEPLQRYQHSSWGHARCKHPGLMHERYTMSSRLLLTTEAKMSKAVVVEHNWGSSIEEEEAGES